MGCIESEIENDFEVDHRSSNTNLRETKKNLAYSESMNKPDLVISRRLSVSIKNKNKQIKAPKIDNIIQYTNKSSVLPPKLRNTDNICYMISTFQCLNASFYSKNLNLNGSIVENMLARVNDISNTTQIEKLFNEFKDKYFNIYSNQIKNVQLDTKEFYIKVLNMFSPSARDLFLIKNKITIKCSKSHSNSTDDEFALCNFTNIAIFCSNFDNYFKTFEKGLYYCLTCKSKTNCEIVVDYKFNEFIVIYFSDHDYSINIKGLSTLIKKRNLYLIAIIQRFGISRSSGHFISYVHLDSMWFRCNDSSIDAIQIFLIFNYTDS